MAFRCELVYDERAASRRILQAPIRQGYAVIGGCIAGKRDLALGRRSCGIAQIRSTSAVHERDRINGDAHVAAKIQIRKFKKNS